MKNQWLDYCNSGIKQMHPYIPGKPESQLLRELNLKPQQITKLNSNESLWGPTPTLSEIKHESQYYPDASGFELKQVLAKFHQVKANQITLGNGSNDILDLLARVFLNPNTQAIYSEYAFITYVLSTQAQGAKAKVIKATQYGYDIEQMVSACNSSTRLLFIANPNNPTGTYINATTLYEQFERVPKETIIVLDQAYQEYITDDIKVQYELWLKEFPNLVICRTFSKIYGLASYRIGYAISSDGIANLLNRVRHPFNTNTLAQLAAIKAIQDQKHVQAVLKDFFSAKEMLKKQLNNLNISYIPSEGSFLCCHLPNAQNTINKLAQQGVMVRSVSNYQLTDFARITIGKKEHNQHLIEALKNIL